MKKIFLIFLFFLSLSAQASNQQHITVGAKAFPESQLLAEMYALLLEDQGLSVTRKYGLEGTKIAFTALHNNEIQFYPEYSGTVQEVLLKSKQGLDYSTLQQELTKKFPLKLLEPLGFNNTYALTVRKDFAQQHQLRTISDLRKVPHARFGLSHEFLNRKDGWLGLKKVYRLQAAPVGLQHGLAYEALAGGKIDVTDAYSTDGKLAKLELVLLEDEQHYFPQYLAAPLVRAELSDHVMQILNQLQGRFTDQRMQELNAEVEVEGKSFAAVAQHFLQAENLLQQDKLVGEENFWQLLLTRTITHLRLTFTALLAAMFLAIPLGILAFRLRSLSRTVLYLAGICQTIPSIALLAFMIPFLGIGEVPAMVALFIYSLLPLLRNTVIALFSIDPVLRKVAIGMGLSHWQRLRSIELPLAMPTILAGIRTAAVMNIGTATLAAFIGAGGLGEPIVTGLALNETRLILEGALPAAMLAILTELVFEWIERLLIPKHLLQKQVR